MLSSPCPHLAINNRVNKILVSQLARANFHILLAWGSYMFALVTFFAKNNYSAGRSACLEPYLMLGKFVLKVTCLTGKTACPGQPDGHFLKTCFQSENSL